ncbi:MAG: ribosome biogenesis GTP-binding protein YihA/YsxC [Burkholderiaceae bacterium]
MGRGLQSARFYTTVAKLNQCPGTNLPEVAFAGRSNAGKSTAINKLCQRNRLAFSSKTPGRTQALNYFAIGPEEEPTGFLVDTPGYGYAAVPEAVKKQWQPLAGNYLRVREPLAGVVLMVDCRRKLTDKDLDLLDWVPEHVSRLLLITKADKLSKRAAQQTLIDVKAQYQEANPHIPAEYILFSASKGQGIEAARKLIEKWFEPLNPWQSGNTETPQA